MPKISIVIPIYNTGEYIEKCLTSILNQSLHDIEVICINDGSTDNSMEIVNKFAATDSRIKIFEQENLKQGAARNRGMVNATGEYIGFIDSDDWVDLDYFEKLYNAAKKYDSDIALATNVRIGNGKTKKRINIKEEKFVTELQEKFDIGKHIKNPCPTNKIYRLKMLKENNIIWPEGVYCEDKIFVTQAVYYANGIVAVPEICYYYYRNPHSTVHTHSEKHIQDKQQAKLEVIKFLRSKGVKLKGKQIWTTVKKMEVFSMPLLVIKEGIDTKKYLLFGIIKLLEVKI